MRTSLTGFWRGAPPNEPRQRTSRPVFGGLCAPEGETDWQVIHPDGVWLRLECRSNSEIIRILRFGEIIRAKRSEEESAWVQSFSARGCILAELDTGCELLHELGDAEDPSEWRVVWPDGVNLRSKPSPDSEPVHRVIEAKTSVLARRHGLWLQLLGTFRIDPDVFSVEINDFRERDPNLGLTVTSMLVVTHISYIGSVQRHNDNHPDSAIKVGDRFIEIDGHPIQSWEEFCVAVGELRVLRATLQRNHGLPPPQDPVLTLMQELGLSGSGMDEMRPEEVDDAHRDIVLCCGTPARLCLPEHRLRPTVQEPEASPEPENGLGIVWSGGGHMNMLQGDSRSNVLRGELHIAGTPPTARFLDRESGWIMQRVVTGEILMEESVREWEVIWKDGVRIRQAMDPDSPELLIAPCGQRFCGKLYDDWLALRGDWGFMLTVANYTTLMKPLPVGRIVALS